MSDVPLPTMPNTPSRLDRKIADAHAILDQALTEHFTHHELAGVAVLFSGGNDSTTLAHLMRGRATHAVHANTTIGIEATREHVRDTTAAWGLQLLEETAPTSYEDLVLEQGFPGPAHHYKMYQRLKERGLRAARRSLVTDGRRQRVVFLAGRRRAESTRRADVPAIERIDSVVWVSPLVDWTRDDLDAYRAAHHVPRNPVADTLGMSGECLCGAFAEPGELDDIAAHYPDVAAWIHQLEHRARAAGVPEQRCRWGWGAYRTLEQIDGQLDLLADLEPPDSGPLCSSCDARRDLRVALANHPHPAGAPTP